MTKKINFAGVLKIIKNFEGLGTYVIPAGQAYYSLFYRKNIEKEMELAGLRPGMRICHVGCGAFPFTSIYLARQGYKVVAIDSDDFAVRRAEHVVGKFNVEDKISIANARGEEFDYSGFDRVFISLHVNPKEIVIKKVLKQVGEEGKIIFRNPRSWLKLIYPSISANCLNTPVFCREKEALGKEVVCLSNCREKSLREAQLGERLIITKVPVHPLLPALGLRPGKKIALNGRQCFNGPLIADIDGRKIALGLDLACQIGVRGGE